MTTTVRRALNLDDLYRLKSVEDPRISPDGRWVAFVRVDTDKTSNGYKRCVWLAPTEGGAPVQLTRSGRDSMPRWSPDGRTLAFLSARAEKPQIYLLPFGMPGGEPCPLTQHPNGVSAFNWSPAGDQIAFLAALNAQERAAETLPDDLKASAASKETDEKRFDPRVVRQVPYRVGTSYLSDRYPQLYVIDTSADDAQPRRLTDTDANYTEPQWTPDGQYLYTSRPDDPTRDEPSRHSRLCRVRAADGHEQLIHEDGHFAASPLPAPDGRWLAYLRAPDDGLSLRINRLAVRPANNPDSAAARDLTLAADLNPAQFRWQGAGEALVFSAQVRGAAGIYQTTLDGHVEPLMTAALKVEAFDLGVDGLLAFSASSTAVPSELYVYRPGDPAPSRLTYFNQPVLDEVCVQPVHHLSFTNPDGQPIDGWYLLPETGADDQPVPLIVDIHGGPHIMWGPHEDAMWLTWQYYAAQGYAVFFCNPRGSGGYGEAFQQAIYRGWGTYAYADILAGVEALLAREPIDPARMAVTGGSYGGYMTAWIIAHTDRFVAAVAQRGVYNLLSFFGTTDIPSFVLNEFGTLPLDDPDYLWQHSPLAHAHRITTPLLILHSENDFRVPISEAEQLFGYVRRKGLTTEFVRYPREGHELTRSGEPEHRIDTIRRSIAWFDRYCKAESNDAP